MKFIILSILLVGLVIGSKVTHYSTLSKEDPPVTPPPNQTPGENPPDAKPPGTSSEGNPAFQSLINKIYDYAAEFMRYKEDPEKRRIKSGLLANFYPKKQREMAKKNAVQEKRNGYFLKYLTSPYRFCIFPYSDVNSLTYCDNAFKRISANRALDCKHMMCINCCDHLLYVLKFATTQSIVSEVLGLSDDAGFNKLKGFVTNDKIDQCRNTCDQEYPVEDPIILPPAPKDKNLGRSLQNPAKSCIDIKMNGVGAESDIYFVKTGSKSAFKVYCDMTTDGGGWTLFYNYVHHPFEEFDLDGTKLPTDPNKDKSHMNLAEAGFDQFDVTELRFFCNSNHGSQTRMIHFKTHNPDVLKVAMTGDQNYLKPQSFNKENTALEVPKDNKYFNIVRGSLPKSTSVVGKSAKGGFWDSPFGDGDKMWTIKGSSKTNGRYECDDMLEGSNGSKFETIHQVWFRGMPPSKEFLEARALGKA